VLNRLVSFIFALDHGTQLKNAQDNYMTRNVSRDTVQNVGRRNWYSFKTYAIVFSVCKNFLNNNFSSIRALFTELFRCRASCRATPRNMLRRCSYNFETYPIVFSVCKNPLIINFSSIRAVFIELFRCRAWCPATLRNMLRNVATTTLKHILLYSAYAKTP